MRVLCVLALLCLSIPSVSEARCRGGRCGGRILVDVRTHGVRVFAFRERRHSEHAAYEEHKPIQSPIQKPEQAPPPDEKQLDR